MVVFGSIVNEGYINNGSERLHCIFNKNYDACNYGIFVGVVAFLGSIFFMVLDIYFPQISSVKDRKKAVLLELGFSGCWAFMWFVGFCFLANQWQRTSPDELPLSQGADAARAAIAFSFFSILTWISYPIKTQSSRTPELPITAFLSAGYLCLVAGVRFKNIAFVEDMQMLVPKQSTLHSQKNRCHFPLPLLPGLKPMETLSKAGVRDTPPPRFNNSTERALSGAIQKFLLGTDMTLFTTDHLDGKPNIQPCPPSTGLETVDTYQSPPFTENLQTSPKGYPEPTY
ncbi:hypothetical protein JZ751_015253 [Albula glossodonta]|uniref:MARVEL domain-containing protein n=1 Tax=Albula glossodonta TaxID=121402 RepID=A0A8T2NRQ2_9TELE|nr:hypothetical protein JZ751_015253 [Albula glossodonta]